MAIKSVQASRIKELSASTRWKKIAAVAQPYLYIAPALIFFALFLAFPVFFSIRLSFYQWNGLTGLNSMKFIGLGNYAALLKDSLFWLSLKNTALFSIVTTVAQMSLSFVLAFALWYFPLPLNKVLRAVIFFPGVVSIVILGLTWRELLANGGLVNSLLSAMAGKNLPIQWLGDPKLVMWTVIAIDTWIFTGTNMILWLSGLLSISSELIDAARIDGANLRQLVIHIVIPLLKQVISLSFILNIIGGFQTFAIIYIMTRGGPAHQSEVLSTYVFWNAFYSAGPQEFGYASTIATIMVVILLVFSFVRVKMSKIL